MPGQDPSQPPGGSDSEPGGDPVDRNDLDAVVDAVTVAHRRQGGRAPRPPWPEPLPVEVSAGILSTEVGPGEPAAWLVDDPSRQRRFVSGWHPGQGHLVVVGGPASGTSTTLASVALDLCRRSDPDDLHLYALDLDAGLLTALECLPHVGAVIAPTDGERRARLLRWLDDEVTARRAGGASAAVVLLVDDLAGLARAHDPVRDPELHQRFARIWSDGAAVGVTVAASVARAADLSPELAASAGVVLVHATADSGEGLRFGLRKPTSGLAAGRAVRAGDGLDVQIARPEGGDFASAAAEVAAAAAPAGRGPARIGSLPPKVTFGDLPGSALSEDRRIDIRFAMGDLSLAPTGFALHDGEHALVLGPPRTGRTCALAAMGAAARCAGIEVVVVADRPGDLAQLLGMEPVPVAEIGTHDAPDGRRLLLVDDADRVSDPAGLLAGLAAGRDGSCHLVASATAERLRSSYGHWLNEMRTCRTGVLFRPGPLDGDLLGATLPARLEPLPVPGRGLVVADGAAAVVQVALVGTAA